MATIILARTTLDPELHPMPGQLRITGYETRRGPDQGRQTTHVSLVHVDGEQAAYCHWRVTDGGRLQQVSVCPVDPDGRLLTEYSEPLAEIVLPHSPGARRVEDLIAAAIARHNGHSAHLVDAVQRHEELRDLGRAGTRESIGLLNAVRDALGGRFASETLAREFGVRRYLAIEARL